MWFSLLPTAYLKVRDHCDSGFGPVQGILMPLNETSVLQPTSLGVFISSGLHYSPGFKPGPHAGSQHPTLLNFCVFCTEPSFPFWVDYLLALHFFPRGCSSMFKIPKHSVLHLELAHIKNSQIFGMTLFSLSAGQGCKVQS